MKQIKFTLRLDEDIYIKLQDIKIDNRNRISLNNLITIAIEEYLERKEKWVKN